MTSYELLPCPFCGNSAILEELSDHHGSYFNMGCSKRECGAYHILYTCDDPVENWVTWWNTRKD